MTTTDRLFPDSARRRAPRIDADVNAVVGGYLRDLAFAQSSQQKMFGYKRAAAAILGLDAPLTELLGADGSLPRIAGIGPGSLRVIHEILEAGESPTVEAAVDASGRRADIERRRRLRERFLSRAEVRRVLTDPGFRGPTPQQYRGDLQMHSEWSDGYSTLEEIAEACIGRGYQYSAVTDHSYGLRIARGMSMTDAAAQRRAIDAVNAGHGDRCWPGCPLPPPSDGNDRPRPDDQAVRYTPRRHADQRLSAACSTA